MILPAPAKINLFLHVLAKRSDGMHDLQTVFQMIDLADSLEFALRRDGEIKVHCQADIAPQQNIVIRAAQMLREYNATTLGADITLSKRIAVGAGLGGGSSDAATTLLGLNHLWHTDCEQQDLLEIALQLGADVPLFVHGYSAWGTGLGEVLTPVQLPEHYFVVFVPDVEISTKEMFASLQSFYQGPRIEQEDYQIGDGINQFEEMVCQTYPQIAEIMNAISALAPVRLSGTGSAFFTQCDDRLSAEKLVQRCQQEVPSFEQNIRQCEIAKAVKRSPLQQALAELTR